MKSPHEPAPGRPGARGDRGVHRHARTRARRPTQARAARRAAEASRLAGERRASRQRRRQAPSPGRARPRRRPASAAAGTTLRGGAGALRHRPGHAVPVGGRARGQRLRRGALGASWRARGHRVRRARARRARRSWCASRAGCIRAAASCPSCSPAGERARCSASASCCRPAPPRRGARRLPVDVARTIEELLEPSPLDVVHVHEPFAPSASSRRAAPLARAQRRHASTRRPSACSRRRSRAASSSSSSAASTRGIAVLRRHRRADARASSRPTTSVVAPGRRPSPSARRAPRRRAACGSPSCDQEERAALRLFLRALRRLPDDARLARRRSSSPAGAAPTARCAAALRDRVQRGHRGGRDARTRCWPAPTSSSPPRTGRRPRPGCSLRALAAGAVPGRRAPAPSTRRCSATATLGLLFEPGDADALAAQLERLIADAEPARAPARRRRRRRATRLDWARVADERRGRLRAARRPPPRRRRATRRCARGCASRALIDVDLHMHTDHSHDCATPVEVLLATARERRASARSRSPTTTRSPARSTPRAKAARLRREGDRRRGGQDRRPGRGHRPVHRGEDPARADAARRRSPRSSARAGSSTCRTRSTACTPCPTTSTCSRSSTTSTRSRSSTRGRDRRAFNEEAVRFAAKYRIVGGAGSDSHVAQGLGSVRIRMRDFDGPEEFLESLRDADIIGRPSSLYYGPGAEVPADARRPRRPPGAAARASAGSRRRDAQAADAAARRSRSRAVEPDRRNARHRRRDPREVPRARDPRAQPLHARPAGLRALPARQPDAGARLRSPAGRRLPAQVRARPTRRSRRASPSTAAPGPR